MKPNTKFGSHLPEKRPTFKDGGIVELPKIKLPKPESGGKPKKITTPGKPGDTGPGGANPARDRKKMADGGKVYGAPIDGTRKPSTTRKRPKVGDKDPNYKPRKPRKTPPPTKPPPAKKPSGSTFRDYRGVDGAVEDAQKGKK